MLFAVTLSILSYQVFTVITHGFPKYLLPALPPLLISILPESEATPNRQSAASILLPAFTFGVALLALGDPIYFFRFELREMIAADTHHSELISAVGKHGALWLLLLLAVAWLWQRVPGFGLAHALLLASTIQCATLSTLQATAAYQTNYSYGEEGTMELHERIASSLREDGIVLAPKDVLYRLGRHHQYLGRPFWIDVGALSSALSSPKTQFLCVSVPSVRVETLRSILKEPSVAGKLELHYDKERIGTHTLYCRRPVSRDDRR